MIISRAVLEFIKWIPWVEQNLPFGRMEAARYMRVFTHRESLNETPVLHLKEAVQFLAEPRKQQEPEPEYIEAENFFKIMLDNLG